MGKYLTEYQRNLLITLAEQERADIYRGLSHWTTDAEHVAEQITEGIEALRHLQLEDQ